MKASLTVDGRQVPLNPFVEGFIANLCRGILASLKHTSGATKAVFHIRKDRVELTADDKQVDLGEDKGFAMVIIRDTILGAVSHLKGVRGWKSLTISWQA
jgi:hypothetical protein